jgi:tetratricopeptide (TPR) repeat protein
MASKRDRILKNAEKLVQKGRLDQAIREYEKLLKANTNDTNTVNRLGDLYGRVNEIDKAVELYEKVAHQFAEQGFIPKAIAIYKKINRLAPSRLDIFERLGELYAEQGLVVEAKSQFQMLAEHYVKNEDFESAIRIHQRLGDIDPDDTTTRLKFADLLLESGEVEQAMAAYSDLGSALIKRDRLDEAERLYRRLIKHELPDGEFMAPICRRLLDAGRMTSAQELLTSALRVSSDSIVLKTLQVRAHMTLGDTDSAVVLAKEVLEVDPENPEVRSLVGGVLMSDGDEEQATEMLIPAAEALLEQADYKKAQQMLAELVEVSPDDERVLRLAIRAFRPSGDQEILSRLTTSLADVCFNTGQNDQAKRLYLELVATDPTNQLFRERLAKLDGIDVDVSDNAVTSGAPSTADVPSEIDFVLDDEIEVSAVDGADETRTATGDAAAVDPSERIAEASVFAKYGLHDKAVAHLQHVVREAPDNLEAREALAKQLATVGRRDAAAEIAQPVIESYRNAGNTAAADELGRLVGESPPVTDVVDEDDLVDAEEDEVIIVDIDDEAVEVQEDRPEVAVEAQEAQPEPVSAPAEPPASKPAPAPDSTAIDELVAQVVGDIETTTSTQRSVDYSAAADDLLASAMAEPSVETVTETVEPAVAPETIEPDPAPTSVEPEPAPETRQAEPAEPPTDVQVIREPDVDRPQAVEPEAVEEELVEITAGVDGPATSELAELDLFVEQQLLVDAVDVLERLESEYPDDHELAVRRQRLESLGAWDEASPVEAEPVSAPAATEQPSASARPGRFPVSEVEAPREKSPEDLFDEEVAEEYIDLASELEQELAEEEAMVEEATGRGKGEALLEEVFREFQKGVAEQLSEDDSDTHFNLGIAYKEMGLLEEAINEFRVASHDQTYFVEACTMIGVCSIELGRHAEAAEWYQKALVAPELSVDARTALRYELASAFEQTGEVDQALGLFEQIHEHDPSFRDVSDRLSALTQQRQVN